jgi:hypothetical protein
MFNVNYGEINQLLMTQREVDFVVRAIREMPEDGLIVEWGSGGSTCKWLETISASQRLISVEHNREWYDKVLRTTSSMFPGIGERFKFFHKPEKMPERYAHGYGKIEEENPFGMDEYVFPTPEIAEASVFLVDGIARGACAAVAAMKSKNRDAVILIHDFKFRMAAYNWITQFFDLEVVETMAVLRRRKE